MLTRLRPTHGFIGRARQRIWSGRRRNHERDALDHASTTGVGANEGPPLETLRLVLQILEAGLDGDDWLRIEEATALLEDAAIWDLEWPKGSGELLKIGWRDHWRH